MSKTKTLRNEKTEDGKRIWQAVDKAAERAPQWMKIRIEKVKIHRSVNRKGK